MNSFMIQVSFIFSYVLEMQIKLGNSKEKWRLERGVRIRKRERREIERERVAYLGISWGRFRNIFAYGRRSVKEVDRSPVLILYVTTDSSTQDSFLSFLLLRIFSPLAFILSLFLISLPLTLWLLFFLPFASRLPSRDELQSVCGRKRKREIQRPGNKKKKGKE